jgi:malate synthase
MSENRKLILQMIDEATEPPRMSAHDAWSFLEELIADLEARIEGLRDENPELGR